MPWHIIACLTHSLPLPNIFFMSIQCHFCSVLNKACPSQISTNQCFGIHYNSSPLPIHLYSAVSILLIAYFASPRRFISLPFQVSAFLRFSCLRHSFSWYIITIPLLCCSTLCHCLSCQCLCKSPFFLSLPCHATAICCCANPLPFMVCHCLTLRLNAALRLCPAVFIGDIQCLSLKFHR